MSEKTQLVFWPHVGETRQNTLHWEETRRIENDEEPEDSGSGSETQVYPVMETREYTNNVCMHECEMLRGIEKQVLEL
jgi:hypothetical protein